jgi:hypothetical protein
VICAEPVLRLGRVQAAAALNNLLFDAQRRDLEPHFASNCANLALFELPGPHFMPRFEGVSYWEPHKIYTKCYFSTA